MNIHLQIWFWSAARHPEHKLGRPIHSSQSVPFNSKIILEHINIIVCIRKLTSSIMRNSFEQHNCDSSNGQVDETLSCLSFLLDNPEFHIGVSIAHHLTYEFQSDQLLETETRKRLSKMKYIVPAAQWEMQQSTFI